MKRWTVFVEAIIESEDDPVPMTVLAKYEEDRVCDVSMALLDADDWHVVDYTRFDAVLLEDDSKESERVLNETQEVQE